MSNTEKLFWVDACTNWENLLHFLAFLGLVLSWSSGGLPQHMNISHDFFAWSSMISCLPWMDIFTCVFPALWQKYQWKFVFLFFSLDIENLDLVFCFSDGPDTGVSDNLKSPVYRTISKKTPQDQLELRILVKKACDVSKAPKPGTPWSIGKSSASGAKLTLVSFHCIYQLIMISQKMPQCP